MKKTVGNWLLVIYGIHGKQILKNRNEKTQLYVQNNTKLLF
jgi:hypothetical protein